MADKSVGELIAAKSVTPTDLFVLEQNGTAKKLTGQILENWLVSFADGHGGIQSIKKLSTSGLADTYRITLADTTTFDFVVTNGRGITGISKTSTSGLVDTYTISYNNGTTSKFTVTNGAKGDKGDNSYIWIKYASQKPTESSHSIGDIPDDWIGVYSGNASTAPTDWQQYKWYKIKGEKGDTGAPAVITAQSIQYQASNNGTVIPTGTWSNSIPAVTEGQYLWTRTIVTYNSGTTTTAYSVGYKGINGTGAGDMIKSNYDPQGSVEAAGGIPSYVYGQVPSAAQQNPQMDGQANVGSSSDYARADHRHPTDTTRAKTDLSNVSNGSVKTAMLDTDSVTAPKIADNAVSVVKSFQLPTTGWTRNSDDVYEADVTVSGLKTTDTVVLGLRRGTTNPNGWTLTLAAFDSDQETFSKILAGRITATNTLHLYAREAITNAIYLNCWVVSK